MADRSPQLSLAEQIDSQCDRYEEAFRAHDKPRIEAFLASVDDTVRPLLLKALLELDIELRRGLGETPLVSDYDSRFPQDRGTIQAVFDDIARAASLASSVKLTGVETSDSPKAKTAPANASATLPLTKLGRFEIRSILGEGAFGTVYRAYDPQLDRDVAVKVPRFAGSQSREERERFLREARAAAGLHHAHICPVHEVGTIDGRDYIVMAFIDGKPIVAAAFAAPIELKAGKHELVVHKDDRLFKRFVFDVGAGQSDPVVVQDVTPQQNQNPTVNQEKKPPVNENPLIGDWDWGWGDVEPGKELIYQNEIKVLRDGTCLSKAGGLAGTWVQSGNQVVINWANNAKDTVTLSEDGRYLVGVNREGSMPVRGRKKPSDLQSPANAKHSQLIERIEQMGGTLTRDEARPDRLVIGVSFYSAKSKPNDLLLAELQHLPDLQTLNLWGSDQVTDDGLRHVGMLKSLRSLDLGLVPIGDAGIVHLTPLKQLTNLNLSHTRVTDGALPTVASLHALQSLALDNVPVTDEGMKPLGELTELSYLNLLSTKIHGPGLRHLAKLSKLSQLWLSGSPVSDEGVEHIVALPAVSQLYLAKTKVTDKSLAHLAKLKSLRELSLEQTAVTNTGIEQLRQSLPDCRIVR